MAKDLYASHIVDSKEKLKKVTLNEMREYLFEVEDCLVVPAHNIRAVRDQGQMLGAILAAMEAEPLA